MRANVKDVSKTLFFYDYKLKNFGLNAILHILYKMIMNVSENNEEH